MALWQVGVVIGIIVPTAEVPDNLTVSRRQNFPHQDLIILRTRKLIIRAVPLSDVNQSLIKRSEALKHITVSIATIMRSFNNVLHIGSFFACKPLLYLLLSLLSHTVSPKRLWLLALEA
jgi:hypothetical protein